MLDSLHDFFLFVIFNNNGAFDYLEEWLVDKGAFTGDLTLMEYLADLCSIISVIFIFVLCCLFVYKIVRLIGGLIR